MHISKWQHGPRKQHSQNAHESGLTQTHEANCKQKQVWLHICNRRSVSMTFSGTATRSWGFVQSLSPIYHHFPKASACHTATPEARHATWRTLTRPTSTCYYRATDRGPRHQSQSTRLDNSIAHATMDSSCHPAQDQPHRPHSLWLTNAKMGSKIVVTLKCQCKPG